jgi:hypothetical protein
MIEGLRTAARSPGAYGDGFVGFSNGNGYGDGENVDDRGDGFLGAGDGADKKTPPPDSGSGYRPEFFLACPNPANFTYAVINILCRMEP